LYNVVCCDG